MSDDPTAYNMTAGYSPGLGVPSWLNKGDNAWQMISATLVGMQSVPGLVILYGSIVKKKWAVNSAFMALYAYAAVWLCWVTWGYQMSFGEKLLPFWGKAGPALGQGFLIAQAGLPHTTHFFHDGTTETPEVTPAYPMASMVYFQCVFAAITLILLAGSLLGRMNFKAWMIFVPLWLTFSYTIGAFSIWGGGFLFHWGVMDYSGGYVIHLSSGVAGFTAAYWVGPRSTKDRERFPPNNVLLMLTGAGLLWMGWAGFNGGDPYSANIDSSLAVLNTNICAATSLLVWTCLDVIFFKKPSVIGAVQGMSGLVCITPGAGTYNSSILLLHPARCHSRESHSRRGVNRPHPTNRLLARLTGSRICNLSPVNPVSRGSAQRTESTIFHPPKGSKIQYNDSRVCLL
jgi:ammonium transporter, Amt family